MHSDVRCYILCWSKTHGIVITYRKRRRCILMPCSCSVCQQITIAFCTAQSNQWSLDQVPVLVCSKWLWPCLPHSVPSLIHHFQWVEVYLLGSTMKCRWTNEHCIGVSCPSYCNAWIELLLLQYCKQSISAIWARNWIYIMQVWHV